LSPSYSPRHAVRSVFISDIHLGSRGCNATALLDFLREVQTDTLYLVGDIVDIWSLRKSFYWPQEHNNVLRTLLGKAKHGTRVVYVPGNHDEDAREFVGTLFGNLEIQRDCIHTTALGERLLVLHGDEFDSVVKCSPWLAALGSHAYDFSIEMNRHFNRVRRFFGYDYWSLANYLKHKVKNAVNYISSFEQAVAHFEDILYCNDGDWVESCSALIEDRNGRLSIWNWLEMQQGLEVPTGLSSAKAA
jgi:UDP-2,3-diacylglucosamine pyrophosphatase LpxH